MHNLNNYNYSDFAFSFPICFLKPRKAKAEDALIRTLTHKKILTHFSDKITHEPTMDYTICSLPCQLFMYYTNV